MKWKEVLVLLLEYASENKNIKLIKHKEKYCSNSSAYLNMRLSI